MRSPAVVFSLLLLTWAGPGAAQALPDPTRPPDYAPQAAPVVIPKDVLEWTLTAIKIAPHSRSAILNGEVVTPGDVLGPATVLEIDPDAVILEYDGHKLTVPLLKESVKRPVARNDRKGN